VVSMDSERSISNLVYGLAEAIDDSDLDHIEALFGDATFTLAGREPRVGGARFREVIERGMLRHEGSPRTLHVVTNLVIDIDGTGDAASSSSSISVLQCVPPAFPLQVVMVGRYLDRFVRDDAGGWRFSARLMHVDLVGDTSFHTPNRF
jgi:hypothetical protein